MMTKYTIAFLIAGLVAGVLFTPLRRHLKSPWLWGGVILSVLIFLPNVVWQINHHFVSLQFLQRIHARDVRIGRTDDFLIQQLYVSANLFTLPLWLAGLYFYLLAPQGRRYRALGWMFVVPLALLFVARGRFYYMAPAYPMLLAAGTVWWERWLETRRPSVARIGRAGTWACLTAGAILSGALMLPIAPVNSRLWRITARVHDNFSEQIGWPELVQTVSAIYASIPDAEKPKTAILTGNYGEAGAIDLYGPAYGLPRAISGINSYWWRGYGAERPEVVILIGFSRDDAERFANQCQLAGHVANSYGVKNEESKFHPDIFLCRGFKKTWPEFWKTFQRFG
jgi:Dolichyl-phosphate-mannose-protein mannosyltransferase